MIQGSRICITGGAGFIGAVLVGALVERNRITVFDNFSRNALQACSYAEHPNLTVIRGDVCEFSEVEKGIRNADYIIHCAGIAGIDTVGLKPTRTLQVNMIGSFNVLEAAARVGRAKRVVCFSTSEVFGGMAVSSSERDRSVIGAVGEARWTYAVSKLAEEHMAIA